MPQVPARRRQGGSMTTRRENPLERLQRDFDSLFGRMTGGLVAPFSQEFETMRVWDFDVSENDQEYTVRAELPGFEPNEVDIQVDNNQLTIRAEEEQRGDGHEEYRNFYRTMTLPSAVDSEKARATYRNGVLELHIPKAASARPKRVQIEGDGGAEEKGGSPEKQAKGESAQSGSAKSASAKSASKQSGEGGD